MKANTKHNVIKAVKGLLAAVLIAVLYFLLNNRLPASGDVMGLVALAAACTSISLGGFMIDNTDTEDLLGFEPLGEPLR